ncbi:MAG: apolipoprotein N-acyltransferase [Alphaproteobacteria bacterium]
MIAPGRLAARIGALSGWRRWALAAMLGMLAAAALPPVHAVIALVVAVPPLIWLIDGAPGPRRAFADGWWFGLGYFIAGLYWISYSLLVDGDRFAWMIPFAVFGIPAALAIYIGFVAVVTWYAPPGWTRIVAFAAAWTMAEWLRGVLFTGFPWNLLGTVWTLADAPLQFAAIGGVLGLGLVTAFVAAAPAALCLPGRSRWGVPALAAAVLAALWGGGAARLAVADSGTVPGVMLRLVQPNIAQRLKWRRELRDSHLARYVALSRQPGARAITHLIWPESAVPFLVSEDDARRRIMAATIPPGGVLLTGALRRGRDPDGTVRLWNSLHVIDPGARILATYDKVHLVPFGEYVPLRGILDVAKVTAGRTDFSAGPGARLITPPGLPPVRPLICYEAIFSGETVGPGARPGWLLNVTNDAWFGISSGPYQHFAAARLRAVEHGLPLVRVANTGISGIVDGYGRVQAKLGLDRAGVIDAPLPDSLFTSTVYADVGDDLPVGCAIFLLGLAFFWKVIKKIRYFA